MVQPAAITDPKAINTGVEEGILDPLTSLRVEGVSAVAISRLGEAIERIPECWAKFSIIEDSNTFGFHFCQLITLAEAIPTNIFALKPKAFAEMLETVGGNADIVLSMARRIFEQDFSSEAKPVPAGLPGSERDAMASFDSEFVASVTDLLSLYSSFGTSMQVSQFSIAAQQIPAIRRSLLHLIGLKDKVGANLVHFPSVT